jgi:hypothetical protein
MFIRSLINPAVHEAEGAPAGGNPAAMVTPPVTTVERAFSAEYVRELREEAKNNRLEAAAMKTKLAEFETTTAAQKASAEKAVADANKRFEEFQKASTDKVIRTEVRAGAKEAGLLDLDLIKLIDISGFKVNEDGDVVAPEGYWTTLKAAKPHFFAVTGADKGTTTNTTRTPPPAKSTGKKAAEMTEEEFNRELAALTSARR